MLFGRFGRFGLVHMLSLRRRPNFERQILLQQFKNVALVDCKISHVAEKSILAVVGNEIFVVEEFVEPIASNAPLTIFGFIA